MSKQAGVTKIVITIAGKEIACTPEQIKDLKECLDKLYGGNTVVNNYSNLNYPWWQYPKPQPTYGNGIGIYSLATNSEKTPYRVDNGTVTMSVSAR